MSRVEIYREDVRIPAHSEEEVVDGVTFRNHYSAAVRPGKGKWRWRFLSNGHIMADSGQSYSRRIDALNGCATVLGGVVHSTDLGPVAIVRTRTRAPSTLSYDRSPVVDLTREAKP